MNTVLLALVAAATATTPALADPLTTKPADTAEAPAPAPKKVQRVCLVDTVTGSRVAHKTCRTREEWARMNVELPAAR